MGNKKKIRLTFLLVAIASAGFAQKVINVTGIVADSASAKPLSFVNVVVKKTNFGTRTDQKGYFSINAHPSDTLKFSFVGYKTLELPAFAWEPSVIMMAEEVTILRTMTVHGESMGSPYDHLFDEENRKLAKSKKPIPFYYAKDKKDKILLGRAKQEHARVKNYVDLIVKDDKVKNDLMKLHHLNETQYYHILAMFNQKNYAIMYYLTDTELLSLLYRFYDVNADQ